MILGRTKRQTQTIGLVLALLLSVIPAKASAVDELLSLRCWADPPGTDSFTMNLSTVSDSVSLISFDPGYSEFSEGGTYVTLDPYYITLFEQEDHTLKISVDRYTGRYEARILDRNALSAGNLNVGTCKEAKEPLF